MHHGRVVACLTRSGETTKKIQMTTSPKIFLPIRLENEASMSEPNVIVGLEPINAENALNTNENPTKP